jgi:nucleoside-diphosphate-sugar epimerase
MPSRPTRLLVTGASGFVGRHLLEAIKDDYQVYGIARRSQARSGAPEHPNIHWFQADIGDREPLLATFRKIKEHGGVDAVIHLAAHYDFTGSDHPDYWRTNVSGLRNVLDASREIGIKLFVFSSSVAACPFPRPGEFVDETTPPTGTAVYSKTKAIGEAMVQEYRDFFKPITVRFAALFSDWCEYPPLFMLLETWFSDAWNARVLAGRGRSAVPYMHVREIPILLQRVLDRWEQLPAGEVLVLSTDGSTSHAQLFEAATAAYGGQPRPGIFLPKWICAPGIRVRDLVGRIAGHRPFERAWMVEYIDRALDVRLDRTKELLGWTARERLEILRRVPFLVENLKADPLEWHRRNRAALHRVRVGDNLRIHLLFERHEHAIAEQLTEYMHGPEGREQLPHYQALEEKQEHWHHHLALRALMNAVRTRERAVYLGYCDDLARRRFEQGFEATEVCHALLAMERIALQILRADPECEGLEAALQQYVGTNVRFGCDRIHDVFETLYEEALRHAL